ncbi:MAG: response regulator transcription factor [Myxococcota bacterium]|nr:response regulator transcription factor [Myxococcota bacterium]
MTRYRILLVDDHPIYRIGLADLINREEDLQVVEQAPTTSEAMEKYRSAQPDLIISDLTFSESSGISLIKKIRALPSRCPILVLSMHEEKFWAEQVLQEGANGYIQKDAAIHDVLAAIKKTAAGEIYLSHDMQQRVLRQLTETRQEHSILNALSRREVEIFQYLAQGFSNADIAQALFISVKTVQAHQSNMKRKLRQDTLADLRDLAEKHAKPGPND